MAFHGLASFITTCQKTNVRKKKHIICLKKWKNNINILYKTCHIIFTLFFWWFSLCRCAHHTTSVTCLDLSLVLCLILQVMVSWQTDIQPSSTRLHVQSVSSPPIHPSYSTFPPQEAHEISPPLFFLLSDSSYLESNGLLYCLYLKKKWMHGYVIFFKKRWYHLNNDLLEEKKKKKNGELTNSYLCFICIGCLVKFVFVCFESAL